MNDHEIDALLKSITDAEVPPEVEHRLRQRLRAFARRVETRKTSSWRTWFTPFGPRRLAWAGGAALAALVLVLIALNTLQPPGGRLYAAAMKALEAVRTVHMTGWKTSLDHYSRGAAEEQMPAADRYPWEIWEWVTEDGRRRQYERRGPIVEWDDGERRYEHNEHFDRLWIRESHVGDLAEALQNARGLLDGLRSKGARITDLGERRIADRLAQGVRAELASRWRQEWWLDKETDLPIELIGYQWENGEWALLWKATATYNERVPEAIASYVPPKAVATEYHMSVDPRFETWRLHLRRLEAHYRRAPLPKRLELVERESDERFDTVSRDRMPGIEGYWVTPIQGTLGDYLRGNRLYPIGSLRVPEDAQRKALNRDLVYKDGVTLREQEQFVLDLMGLELVEVTEERTVWVAHHDGRRLKPWREVKAPVSREGARAIGAGMASTFGMTTLRKLFDAVAWAQDYGLTARGIIIVDETGLPTEAEDRESIAVASEGPHWGWPYEESREIAKHWFAEEFGVTFTEETRPVTVHVVRKKTDAD